MLVLNPRIVIFSNKKEIGIRLPTNNFFKSYEKVVYVPPLLNTYAMNYVNN